MTYNPYSPPNAASLVASDTRQRRPYGPWTAALQTAALGGVGTLLAWSNHLQLQGWRGALRGAVTLVFPAFLLVLGAIAAGSSLGALIIFFLRVLLAWVVLRDQRALVAPHLASGGTLAPWWRAWIVGIALYVIPVGVWVFLTPTPATRVAPAE